MDEVAIASYITETFAEVATTTAHGYIFFFYGSDRKLPFATIATNGNEFERVSDLDRPGVFRLNIGVGRDTYRALFGPHPPRLGADGIVDTGHDFTVLDQLLPHPHYAPQSWICVLNPSAETFQKLQPLLSEAYERAVKRQTRKRPEDAEEQDESVTQP